MSKSLCHFQTWSHLKWGCCAQYDCHHGVMRLVWPVWLSRWCHDVGMMTVIMVSWGWCDDCHDVVMMLVWWLSSCHDVGMMTVIMVSWGWCDQYDCHHVVMMLVWWLSSWCHEVGVMTVIMLSWGWCDDCHRGVIAVGLTSVITVCPVGSCRSSTQPFTMLLPQASNGV